MQHKQSNIKQRNKPNQKTIKIVLPKSGLDHNQYLKKHRQDYDQPDIQRDVLSKPIYIQKIRLVSS